MGDDRRGEQEDKHRDEHRSDIKDDDPAPCETDGYEIHVIGRSIEREEVGSILQVAKAEPQGVTDEHTLTDEHQGLLDKDTFDKPVGSP